MTGTSPHHTGNLQVSPRSVSANRWQNGCEGRIPTSERGSRRLGANWEGAPPISRRMPSGPRCQTWQGGPSAENTADRTVIGCPLPPPSSRNPPNASETPALRGFGVRKTSLLFEGKGQKTGDPGGFKLHRLRFPQTDPAFLPPLCNFKPGLYKTPRKHLGPLK